MSRGFRGDRVVSIMSQSILQIGPRIEPTHSADLKARPDQPRADDTRFDTTVVIPVYYNERSVGQVVSGVRDAWAASGRDIASLEFVLIDDGSKDGSWNALRQIQDSWPAQVSIIRLAVNHGSQLAVLAGASLAHGRRVAILAADGQEPGDLIPRLAEAADTGYRVALAVRRSREDSAGTKAGANSFYLLIRLLGLRGMPAEGFDVAMLDRGIFQDIIAMRDPNIPLAVTIAWLGYPYARVEYDRLVRTEGKSRWTLRKKIKLALDAITAVSYVPIRAISLFGIVLALLGFAYAMVVVAAFLLYGSPVRGWPTLLVVILVIGGTQLISLGVIGEYLWRTLEVARRRPMWRIAEIRTPSTTPTIEM
jgi:dolichol-phosphate mannosyltransferase